MDRFAQRFLPDWGWDRYRWHTNYRRARERFSSFRGYQAYQARIRQLMWGDKS